MTSFTYNTGWPPKIIHRISRIFREFLWKIKGYFLYMKNDTIKNTFLMCSSQKVKEYAWTQHKFLKIFKSIFREKFIISGDFQGFWGYWPPWTIKEQQLMVYKQHKERALNLLKISIFLTNKNDLIVTGRFLLNKIHILYAYNIRVFNNRRAWSFQITSKVCTDTHHLGGCRQIGLF